MTYSKQNFTSGATLYASQLNSMDNQIASNDSRLSALEGDTSDLTYTTIYCESSQILYDCFVASGGNTSTTATGYVCTEYISMPFASSQQITLRTVVWGNASFAFYDSAKNALLVINGNNAATYGITKSTQMQVITMDIPSGTAFVRLSGMKYSDGSGDWEQASDFYIAGYIEESSTIVQLRSDVDSMLPYVDTSFASKKVLVVGDSISTDSYGSYEKWVTKLINSGFFTMANVTNNSYHATGFVATYEESGSVMYDTFLNRVTALEDKDTYDAVVVFGGINDYIQAIDFDTFKSAVDAFFEYVTVQFVNAKIYVISPLRTYNVYQNTAGHYQQEYAEYIRTVAKTYCLPVLNLTENSGYYPFVDEFKAQWTFVPSGSSNGDGVHPNEDYMEKFLAPMIRSFLQYGGSW